jgi:glycosyltransferase involved in cell wall biosynthesis
MSGRLIIPDAAFWAGEAIRSAPRPVPSLLVAIPVRNESERIGTCLAALAAQVDLDGCMLRTGTFGIVLLLNNCRDDTAGAVAARPISVPIWTVARDLPPSHAHAGAARRLAMDAAVGWLMAGDRAAGAILTTDADTRVAPDWIARHQTGFERGLDGMAGYVVADPIEHAALPRALRRRDRLEARYATLLSEIDAWFDPAPHDPWPRHQMAAGASLGVTLAAYAAIGGLPLRPVGEDRALVAALLARDARVRHDPAVRVTTSCRLVGRAVGGMADTLQRRLIDPNAFCDEALEPVLDALHRNFWRGTLRRSHADGSLGMDWAASLGIAEAMATELCRLEYFGTFWQAVERCSPSLRRNRLHPDALPIEILRARGVVGWLRSQTAAPMRIAVAS